MIKLEPPGLGETDIDIILTNPIKVFYKMNGTKYLTMDDDRGKVKQFL